MTARLAALARAIGLPGLRDTAAPSVLPRTLASGATAARAVVHPAGRWLLRIGSAGLIEHATLRMVAIDHALHGAVNDGCRQVVILGAGLDTRAWRLEALAPCTVWEVDLPAIQEAKQRRLSGREPVAADVQMVAADLADDDLGQVLKEAGHDPAAPTAWVWEAVAVYLPRPAITTTLEVVADRSAPSSRLLMSFVPPDLLPGPAVLDGAARAGFDALGEPLRTLLEPDELETLVEGAGLRLTSVTGWRDWAALAGVTPRLDLLAAEQLAEIRP